MESTSDNVRKSRLSGLIEAMAALGICVLMMIRKEYVFTDLSSYFIIYGAGIIVGALIARYASGFIPEDYPRGRISLIVLIFIFIVLLTAFIIGEINYRFDNGMYIPKYAVVTDTNQYSLRRGPDICTMTVEHKGTEYTFRVRKDNLRYTQPGNYNSIIVCDGFLGMEYIDLLVW